MSKDLMKYDQLARDALRGVVRMALERVRDSGLPGGHHFYIGFRTDHPGVDISDALRERFPVDMTIVIQHQFWDLEITEDRFVVSLSFNKMPERLEVPFSAVKTFFDPSVQFGLNFDMADEGDLEPAEQIAFPRRDKDDTPSAFDKDRVEKAIADAEPTDGGAADVVSLDTFRARKK